ncbi:sigma factor-like helix-turn-helix DNA-binding protein [Pedobacter mucosus]|uniref:sigma factor-like helix-turn-helix DNA-binding protein n=1 Tax=Pedobacter mucosus TaxID=2895286 RepID=UPI00349EF0C8
MYIEKEINALPPKMGLVFKLSRKRDLSNKEIAQRLDVTESNISYHISNAVKILRIKLSVLKMVFSFLGLARYR